MTLQWFSIACAGGIAGSLLVNLVCFLLNRERRKFRRGFYK